MARILTFSGRGGTRKPEEESAWRKQEHICAGGESPQAGLVHVLRGQLHHWFFLRNSWLGQPGFSPKPRVIRKTARVRAGNLGIFFNSLLVRLAGGHDNLLSVRRRICGHPPYRPKHGSHACKEYLRIGYLESGVDWEAQNPRTSLAMTGRWSEMVGRALSTQDFKYSKVFLLRNEHPGSKE